LDRVVEEAVYRKKKNERERKKERERKLEKEIVQIFCHEHF
jgi:hypothetical protein